MNGNELLKKLKKLARKQGTYVKLDKAHGKGSHSTLRYGDRKTIIKDGRKEIGKGLLRSMLKDLGLTEDDL